MLRPLRPAGPWEVSAGGTLVWPAGVHGVCGDKAGDLRHEPGEWVAGGRRLGGGCGQTWKRAVWGTAQCAQVLLQRLTVGAPSPGALTSAHTHTAALRRPLHHPHPAGGVYGPAGVQATYTAGQVITISLLVTAQHGGRHTFRICDRANADEACLYANVLQR